MMMMNQDGQKDRFALLSEAFDGLNQINEEFYGKIGELQEQVGSLQEKVRNLESDKRRLLEEKDGKLAEMSGKLDAMSGKIDESVSPAIAVLGNDIGQIAGAVGRIEASQEEVQDLERRKQEVADAEEQIRKANAAREKAKEALAAMTQDRDKYKQLWEQARTQAAARNAPSPKDRYGRNQSNAAGVSQNSKVQELIDNAVTQNTQELEAKYQQEMKAQNDTIDRLNRDIEDLKKQLNETNDAFNELAKQDPSYDSFLAGNEDACEETLPATPDANVTDTLDGDDDESGGIVSGVVNGDSAIPPADQC